MGSWKICQCCGWMPPQTDGASDAFALRANDFGEVHASGVLNENIERCGHGYRGQREMRLSEPPVERANELLVDIDLRIIVEPIDDEFAAGASGKLRPVEDVAVGLVEIFHGEEFV